MYGKAARKLVGEIDTWIPKHKNLFENKKCEP